MMTNGAKLALTMAMVGLVAACDVPDEPHDALAEEVGEAEQPLCLGGPTTPDVIGSADVVTRWNENTPSTSPCSAATVLGQRNSATGYYDLALARNVGVACADLEMRVWGRDCYSAGPFGRACNTTWTLIGYAVASPGSVWRCQGPGCGAPDSSGNCPAGCQPLYHTCNGSIEMPISANTFEDVIVEAHADDDMVSVQLCRSSNISGCYFQ